MTKQKVLVTGSSGMLGTALIEELKKFSQYEVFAINRQVCDLLDSDAVFKLFNEIKPDCVFNCAAKVGGIAANKAYPADFLMDNLKIQNNIFEAAHQSEVKRLISFASNAVYPEGIERPISESDILTGTPEATVRPYAVAKLAGIEACYAFNQQFGTRFIALIPVNLYGPNDNFHPQNSHVLPALLRKFHNAKVNDEEKVEIWGSGNQRREFMCSLDLARLAVEVLGFVDEKFDDIALNYPPMINMGVGVDTSIKELAGKIAEHVGFKGRLEFDTSKPEGIGKKQTAVEKMHQLGLQHKIDLEEGIGVIYDYFVENIADD